VETGVPKTRRIKIMVFNATFNNISVISCHAILLVEETRVPGKNHRAVASPFYFSSNFDYYYFLFELIVSRAPADFLNQTSYGFQVRLGCSTYHY
jgi:hypothetical protein